MINEAYEGCDQLCLEEELLSTSLEPHQFDPRLSNADFIRDSLFDGPRIKEELCGHADNITNQQQSLQSASTTASAAEETFYNDQSLRHESQTDYDAYLKSSSPLNADTCDSNETRAVPASRQSKLAPPVAKRRFASASGYNSRRYLQTSTATTAISTSAGAVTPSPSNSSSDAQSPMDLGNSGSSAAMTVGACAAPVAGYTMATGGSECEGWSTMSGQKYMPHGAVREIDSNTAPTPEIGASFSYPTTSHSLEQAPQSMPPQQQQPQQRSQQQHQPEPDDCVQPPPPLRFQSWDEAPALDLLEVDDATGQLLRPADIAFKIEVDKGFHFSGKDGIWICQKKNHFQITCFVGATGSRWAVSTGGPTAGPQAVTGFRVNLYGVKAESPLDSLVSLEQSEVNRLKRLFAPIPVRLPGCGVTVRVVAQRLHFAATTMNNQRKRGDLHPDQRFFQLVLALEALTDTAVAPVKRYISRLIIVRASNPGQFEVTPPAASDASSSSIGDTGDTANAAVAATVAGGVADSNGASAWISKRPGVVYCTGRVGINTPQPAEALTVNGNLQLRGSLLQPSDARIKSIERELSPADQLANISRIKIYSYSLSPSVSDTGVIAQEVAGILPDAVHASSTERVPNGEPLLLVNKDRIYMENVGAVKQLGELTASLDCRIGQLEQMRSRLCRLRDSLRSSSAASSSVASSVSRGSFGGVGGGLSRDNAGEDFDADTASELESVSSAVVALSAGGPAVRSKPRMRTNDFSEALHWNNVMRYQAFDCIYRLKTNLQ